MSSSPDHLSRRTLAPGALLAILVTAGALFALAVVIAVGPDGPARLWLDGGSNTLNLRAGEQAGSAGGVTLAGSPAGLLTAAPTAGPKGAVTLAATPRTTARLRSNTRVQRRTVRVPAARRPTQPSPSGTKPTSPTRLVSAPAATTPRPAATPAPGSTVVKNRGRPNNTESKPVAVRKQRAGAVAPGPASADVPVQRVPVVTPAPSVDKTPAAPSTQPDSNVPVTRVPPPPTGG